MADILGVQLSQLDLSTFPYMFHKVQLNLCGRTRFTGSKSKSLSGGAATSTMCLSHFLNKLKNKNEATRKGTIGMWYERSCSFGCWGNGDFFGCPHRNIKSSLFAHSLPPWCRLAYRRGHWHHRVIRDAQLCYLHPNVNSCSDVKQMPGLTLSAQPCMLHHKCTKLCVIIIL